MHVVIRAKISALKSRVIFIKQKLAPTFNPNEDITHGQYTVSLSDRKVYLVGLFAYFSNSVKGTQKLHPRGGRRLWQGPGNIFFT